MEALPAPRIYIDPAGLEPRLQRVFGVGIAELQAVAAAALGAFIRVSSLHPKGFNGTSAWAEATSHLRATLIPRGWLSADPQGQPRVVSKSRKVAITVSSGNADTGVPERIPQTRNDKGAQTAGGVGYNARQGQLFPFAEATFPDKGAPGDGQALWIFLYYIDFDAHQMRIELSQPTRMSEADKVNDWSTRFILPPLQFAPDIAEGHDRDDGPDVDFDITPKHL